jgi:hypothetical protein
MMNNSHLVIKLFLWMSSVLMVLALGPRVESRVGGVEIAAPNAPIVTDAVDGTGGSSASQVVKRQIVLSPTPGASELSGGPSL